MSDNQEDPLIMYLIINQSMNLSTAKIGIHTAHAATTLAINTQLPAISDSCLKTFHEWYANGAQRKALLSADHNEWEKLKELLKDNFENGTAVLIKDAGIVELPAGTETCIALMPMLKSQRPKLIKRLQALK